LPKSEPTVAEFPINYGAIGKSDSITRCLFVMRTPIENTGFTPPTGRSLSGERRSLALAELIASLALAVATVVVATVVTAGIARADVADGVIGHESSLFGVALLLGLAFIGMSGLSFVPNKPKRR
jgi:heme/copper-type cytochrome/quinol oxidase subunit 3